MHGMPHEGSSSIISQKLEHSTLLTFLNLQQQKSKTIIGRQCPSRFCHG